MKLTGDLKKQVETAQTKEETKDAIKEAGMELADDELDMVSGGTDDGVEELFVYQCTKCGRTYAVRIPPLNECPNKLCGAKNTPGNPNVIVPL